ncbi:hypothetical protein [Oceanisphaera psychrotolerans]|uniref:hypothetical protein n=1 Tax=Oceanisphaera psychrotolerans TaxID=1414654 RepID=UPI000A54ED91|nr:hypothetical protein [Oceanisphaera psychrotolerans]
MISVERKDGFALKVSRILREATEHRLDIYFFIPGELGLNTNVVPEDEFYHNAIHVQRTYFSDRPHLHWYTAVWPAGASSPPSNTGSASASTPISMWSGWNSPVTLCATNKTRPAWKR